MKSSEKLIIFISSGNKINTNITILFKVTTEFKFFYVF